MADFDPRFLSHPETQDLFLLTGKRAVFQSFKTLVLSSITDFIMRTDIHGGEVYNTLFQNDNALIRNQVKSRIEEIARIDEPRITVKDVLFESIERHQLTIRIIYLYENELDASTDFIKVVRTS
ncbi:lysozyme family protein [Acinetobacter phage SH-Ab 15599]|nr:lysozyme family protein [Acinetobacter phage SH-Ab 15599]